jgi:hypothetical protein
VADSANSKFSNYWLSNSRSTPIADGRPAVSRIGTNGQNRLFTKSIFGQLEGLLHRSFPAWIQKESMLICYPSVVPPKDWVLD